MVGVAAALIVLPGLLTVAVPAGRLMETVHPIAVRLIVLVPEAPTPAPAGTAAARNPKY